MSTINTIVESDADSDRCHKCESKYEVTRHPFGLAEILLDKRDWWETIWSVAVSAVSLPTIGVGRLALPGRSKEARILRLHLPLCRGCVRKSTGAFGGIKLRNDDYKLHPSWNVAQQLGFTEWISPRELSGFKPREGLNDETSQRTIRRFYCP